jgi:peptide-methionine (R)-S-oxide reductase
MPRRDLLSMLALTAVGGFVLPAWLLAEAEELQVTKTDEEWRRLLTPAQYQVLRHKATEPADSSPLLHEHRKSVFACAGCELPLFKSETKFDSGTGWPSFWSPIEGAGHQNQPEFLDAAHRGALPALRRASWPRL